MIRIPFFLPFVTCTTSSSPRLTRCNTVWREARLSRAENWRRTRLQRLLTDLSDDPDRRKAIRAARLYLEVTPGKN
ncbi:hypothetical protein GWE18_38365 [Bradyrhizobium sp. CSA112]|uniref:hypothetical protein n=1 Tax=Bradyrhizobium sp. CSA112 TaxID=2699170 RepID=UPI0023B1639E|nr:hypothetical protein [Bradyrhizobium sp. CSA112]MDE5458543.1 hypothetical protein [Bradyrhizobium sp. CSA112]